MVWCALAHSLFPPAAPPSLATWPQARRDAVALAAERGLLADLRRQQEAQHEALAAQVAQERAAAASQQGAAERAVHAVRNAELAAAKVLADLQGKARKLLT